MTTTWILTANAAEAHLYKAPKGTLLNGHPTMQHITDYCHPPSRQKAQELVSSRSGQYHKKFRRQGSYSESADPREAVQHQFAREILQDLAKRLQKSKQANEVIIAAAPHFQGILYQHMNGLTSWPQKRVNKDFTQLDESSLPARLADYL